MVRVLTYADPFKLKNNKELWDVITKHPHFCVSDTLVQGLEREYSREDFNYFGTVDTLTNKLLGDYTKNPENDIKLFLNVSSLIDEKLEGNIKKAFEFNKAEVVNSVKFLIELEAEAEAFKKELTDEQNSLLEIYKNIDKDIINTFKKLSNITKDGYIDAVRSTVNAEIKYSFKKCFKELQLSTNIENSTCATDGERYLAKIINYLENKLNKAPEVRSFGGFANQSTHSTKLELTRAQHLSELLKTNDSSAFDKIIIHGVHRITPINYFLFKLLEKLDVEVIFLINYVENLPNIYKTWREVYSWRDFKFEYSEDLDIAEGTKLGQAIAHVFEGRESDIKLKENVTKYSNLTSFTDREVKKTFQKAKEKVKKGDALSKMETQYYAVRGQSSNEILKMYFPDQFGQKPFLAYPIGQFILGLYQMWDFEEKTLKISHMALCECAVSRLYKSENDVNIFSILNKAKLYFSDVETISEIFKRLDKLDASIKRIQNDKGLKSLAKISFFSLTAGDIVSFKNFLNFINDVAKKLFQNNNGMVDYGAHFKTLMDIISIPATGNAGLTKTEEELIDEIKNKLSIVTPGEISGNIKDVKEALAFYLSGYKKQDSSNWIVRDFDQIDGAVLMSKHTKAKNYHFALLSNSQMTRQPDDVLSWPLTIDMFNGYSSLESSVPVVNRGLLEMRNFLKYSLFYGTFFTKGKELQLSFIEEENGEEQKPYYLFDVLGMKDDDFKEKNNVSFETPPIDSNYGEFYGEQLNAQSKELFSICPYKFLHTEVLHSPILYYSDYHIKYYVSTFVFFHMKAKYKSNYENEDNLEKEVRDISTLFPFWNDVIIRDIKRSVWKHISKDTSNSYNYNYNNYRNRKETFLIAQWQDLKTEEKYMNFSKPNLCEKIKVYMKSGALYPNRSEVPHEKVCENCNCADVCLRNFYEANAQSDGGADDKNV